jgi:hypothetical protein
MSSFTPKIITTTQQGNSMVAPLNEASQIPLDRYVIRRMFPNTSKFNGQYVLGRQWAATPFRVYNNAGDLLTRQTEPGGVNQVKGLVGFPASSMYGMIDGTKRGNGASGNQHYVYDSSDYIKFKRLTAKLKTYNDTSFGGANNGAYPYILGGWHGINTM